MKAWLFSAARKLYWEKIRASQKPLDNTDSVPYHETKHFVQDIIERDLMSKVQKDILKLSPLDHEVINLKVWENMTYPEISEITSESVDALRMTLNRSIGKIRSRIDLKKPLAAVILMNAIANA